MSLERFGIWEFYLVLCIIKMDKHPYLFLVFSSIIILSAANCSLLADFLTFQQMIRVFPQFVLLYSQEKQALEKRVSNMEEELKVSACRNCAVSSCV